MDNNSGVFHNLIDAAEEEYKEMILAYYYLLVSERKLTANQLDKDTENWFAQKYTCHIDFDMQDALEKLT